MLLISLLVPAAFPCGGMAPKAGSLAASDAQQALYEIDAQGVTATYRANYIGNAGDFAWVIAVPGVVSEVTEGDGALLDAVEEASAPQVVLDDASESGCGDGCGCEQALSVDKGGNLSDTGFGDSGVSITGQGLAGDYQYTTLAAENANSLVVWLDDHGYETNMIESAVAAYVADPIGYEWVAVQLIADVPDTQGASKRLTPLRIRYGAAEDGAIHAVFPARMGQSSQVDEVRTEIFVLATGYATLSGWEAAENSEPTEENPHDIIGADYWTADGGYFQRVESVGGTVARMWPAYAGAYRDEAGDRWLTRYDAIVLPSTNAVDAVFTDSGEEREVSTTIFMMEEGAFEAAYPGQDEAVFVFAGLLGAYGWRRRRP